jgi:hypothetical protein
VLADDRRARPSLWKRIFGRKRRSAKGKGSKKRAGDVQ